MFRMAAQIPNGTVIGARGPHGLFAPDNALNKWLRAAYSERYGTPPVYPSYKMVQAILGLKAAMEKAAAGKPEKPATDVLISAFASQVRISILLVGLSGAYMLTRLDAWNRFQYGSFWWLDLMVAVWILFALMVYVLEPLAIYRLFHEFALRDKDHTFTVAMRLHALALVIISAFAIGAGVLGAHGGLP